MKKSLIIGLATILGSVPAFAEEAAKTPEEAAAAAKAALDIALAAATSGQSGMIALGAGFAIGIAALGGAIGQGLIGSRAMEGIARNPQSQKVMFVPMILGLVLIESLVIYALIIAFTLGGKV